MVRIVVDGSVAVADAVELRSIYRAVFPDHPDDRAWREEVWDRHTARPGFRLARAYADAGLVGFAYGYTGDLGQWWTDTVTSVLEPEVARTWLGGHFEVVSLGVLAAARGRGTGRQLMQALVRGLPQERLLLQTTADPADPARRLYASEGWQVLGPGAGDHTVVMGRRGARRPSSTSGD